jgi:hypothetical protein
MNRVRALVITSGLSLGLLSASALAMPPVVERVPDDAMIVVTIPNPATLEKNLGALNAAIESTVPVPSIKDMMAMGGLGAGIDATKSVALVVFAPTPDEIKAQAEKRKKAREGGDDVDPAEFAEQKMLTLVPVSNYGEFIASMGGKAEPASKSDAVSLTSGESGFARDLGGGYAVIGTSKALVEGYSGKAGANPLSKRVGKPGEKLADESDIVTIINMEQVRPLVPQMVQDLKSSAKEQAEMMGTDAAAAEKQVAGAIWLIETLSKDAQGMVGGIKLSAAGIAADMNTNFVEGSTFAKAFEGGGKPGALLSKLPGGAYLWAGAIDISNASVKQLFKDLASRTPTPGGEQGLQAALANLDNSKGMAASVGFPMGGAIAGLLTSTVSYSDVADPAAAVTSMKQTMLALDGKSEQGMTYKVTYTDAGAKAGETPVDVWDMKMSMGEGDENQMAAQGMAFIFGPQGGPGGYLAKSEGGVYTTFAKNSELMSKALAAGKGQGELLSADAQTKDTAAKLPTARIAEAYVGVKSIMDLTLPFVGMFGVQVPMDKIPAQLPPVGLAISSDQGQARMSVFVPAPVIKTTMVVSQGVMEQFEGMGGNPDGGGQPEGKSGQPRF